MSKKDKWTITQSDVAKLKNLKIGDPAITVKIITNDDAESHTYIFSEDIHQALEKTVLDAVMDESIHEGDFHFEMRAYLEGHISFDPVIKITRIPLGAVVDWCHSLLAYHCLRVARSR
jgi:hypothetical protein